MGPHLTDKEILLTITQGSDGAAWAKEHEGWNLQSDDTVCFWDGINCDPETETFVVGIYLPAAGLIGTIPSELGKLTTLKELSMPKNLLFGTIPSEVASLPHLESINLGENELTGRIPHFSSKALSKINLSKNSLTGPLADATLEGLENLRDLDVAKNKLTGTIPGVLTKMRGMATVSLSENGFSGTIPEGFDKVENLQYLYFDKNFLVGQIPLSIAGSKSNLRELWLQDNMLSGKLPISFSSMEHLKNVYIGGNKLTGTVPEQICRENLNEEFFSDAPPTTVKNYCDAIACPVKSVSYDGQYPCKPCDSTSTDPYLGREGRCRTFQVDDILKDLYESLGGQDWVGGFDWDNPDYSGHCRFSGVECDFNGNIVGLDLKNRNLKGTIPDTMGFLHFLERLDLSDNDITGFVPSDLKWAPLETLNLGGNRLKGLVPPLLCLENGINGNGEGGTFDCDRVACKVGYYSPTGYASGGETCQPCPSGTGYYLGSKDCSKGLSSPSSQGYKVFFFTFSMVFISLSASIAIGYMALRALRDKRYRRAMSEAPPDLDDWTID